MTPKVPEDYREARRTQIMNAAAECFLQKGFHQTTMQDIFKASGLSAGAVYNYFTGKEEIVSAMGQASLARNTAIASSQVGPEGERTLASVMEAFLGFMRTPEAGRWAPLDLELYAEAARNDTIRRSIQENFRVTMATLIPLVERLQASGVYSSDLEPRAIILVLGMLMQGLQILRVVEPEEDIDPYIDAALAVARGTFCAPGPGGDPSRKEPQR